MTLREKLARWLEEKTGSSVLMNEEAAELLKFLTFNGCMMLSENQGLPQTCGVWWARDRAKHHVSELRKTLGVGDIAAALMDGASQQRQAILKAGFRRVEEL